MGALNYDLRYYINPELVDIVSEEVPGTPLAAADGPSSHAVKPLLEHVSEAKKTKGMHILLTWLASGTLDANALHDKLLMIVIRFVAASKNHDIGKLVHLYWESLMSLKEESSRGEILLVSQIVRNELQSANEYVRGACLRNLAKICTPQILDTVSECIVENLRHRCPYVRRNAAMCMGAFAQKFGPHAVLESDRLEEMALAEIDVGTQRAAILALLETDPVKAATTSLLQDHEIRVLGQICLLAVLQVVKRAFRLMYHVFPPTEASSQLLALLDRATLIQRVETMIEIGAEAVALEAASVLLFIGDFSPAACRTACAALVKVLNAKKDINVRLVIVDILVDVRRRCPEVFGDFAVDVLRVVSAPSAELRQKVLDCCLPTITSRAYKDAVAILKTELIASLQSKAENVQRQLVRSLRTLCSRFHDAAESLIEILLDLLSDSETKASNEVALLMREIIVFIPSLRKKVLEQFVENLNEMGGAKPLKMCIWILGEFCATERMKTDIIDALFTALSPFPLPEASDNFLAADPNSSARGLDEEDARAPLEDGPEAPKVLVRTIVLPDGSYGTENVTEGLAGDSSSDGVAKKVSGLRLAVTSCASPLLIAIIGVALTKVAIKQFPDAASVASEDRQLASNKVLLILGSLIKFHNESQSFGPESAVCFRLRQCLKCIVRAFRAGLYVVEGAPDAAHEAELKKIVEMEREAAHQEELHVVMAGEESWISLFGSREERLDADRLASADCELDDVVNFRLFSGSEINHSLAHKTRGGRETATYSTCLFNEDFLDSLDRAVKGTKKGLESSGVGMALTRSSKALPLSGYSDPVFVEVVMQINHLNLIVEILVVNQTNETLQDVCVALGTHGESKVLERPKSVNLAPHAEATVYATIRLSSTEAGIIFGYCTFERRSSRDTEYFNLNELQIDLLDCIQRAWIGNLSFRTMWTEFEWENKIVIQLPSDDAMAFTLLLLRQTKMTLVGLNTDPSRLKLKQRGSDYTLLEDPDAAETERYIEMVAHDSQLARLTESRIVTLNFCSKSIFGEDALLNLSLEREPGKPMSGSVRIRSRTQGIALSLGDRIAQAQRMFASIETAEKKCSLDPSGPEQTSLDPIHVH